LRGQRGRLVGFGARLFGFGVARRDHLLVGCRHRRAGIGRRGRERRRGDGRWCLPALAAGGRSGEVSP
jgi:hypothetical protein